MTDAIDSTTGLRDKPWIVRVLFASAGCAFNFLVAVASFAIIGWIGTDYEAPLASVIGYVKEGSLPYKAGLRSGDRFVEFDGVPVSTWDRGAAEDPIGVLDVLSALPATRTSESIACIVARDYDGGETTHSVVLPSAAAFAKAFRARELEQQFKPAYIEAIVPFQAAQKGGLKRGDVIVAVDGQPVEAFHEVRQIVSRSAGKALSFTIERGGEKRILVITPKEAVDETHPDEPTIGQIGVFPGNQDRRYFHADGFFAAWGYGFEKAAWLTVRVAVGTGELFAKFTYKKARENLAGPLGIFGLTFQRAREGWRDFLFNMALLNIALLILNILPIPVLDGGHILITTYEGIARRPVPPRVLTSIYTVFLFLIFGLLIMATWIDLARFAEFFGLNKLFQ